MDGGGERERDKNLWTGRDSPQVYMVFVETTAGSLNGVCIQGNLSRPRQDGFTSRHAGILVGTRGRPGRREGPRHPISPIYPDLPAPARVPTWRAQEPYPMPSGSTSRIIETFCSAQAAQRVVGEESHARQASPTWGAVVAVMRPGSSRRVERASRGSRRCSAQAPR